MVDPSSSTLDAAEGGRSSQPELCAGALLGGRYRLEARLGAGAMGEVWRARHEDLNTDVAIKVARLDESAADWQLERFRFEAQVSAQLSRLTRHIVAVHDAGLYRGVPYMVMEYVPGKSLAEIIERDGSVSPARVAELLEQAGEALAVAHQQGIWHRDIKPANIMIVEGASWLLKLADFGVAKALATSLEVERPKSTLSGNLVGTPSYMSPEQIGGEPPAAASDLWSLAAVAYEALTGATAFEGNTLSDVMLAICGRPHAAPSKRARVDPALDAWFDRALAKDPAQRFASVDELVEAFPRSGSPPPRRRWARLLGLGVLGAAALGAGWWWLAPALQGGSSETAASSAVGPEPTRSPAHPRAPEPLASTAPPAPASSSARDVLPVPPRATATSPSRATPQPTVPPPTTATATRSDGFDPSEVL